MIIADTITLYPAHFYTNGLELVTVATRRTPTWALDPRIKSLNYLNNILAKLEAQQAGVLEAVMLNGEGYVAECTADNIFFVRQGQLCTPSTAAGALRGSPATASWKWHRRLGWLRRKVSSPVMISTPPMNAS